LRPLKQKKNIGYSSRNEGEVPIFLLENHVLRKTINKFGKRFFRRNSEKKHIKIAYFQCTVVDFFTTRNR